MAIVKIEEFILYVSDVMGSATENIQAQAYMESTNIPFLKNYYGDVDSAQATLDALNTWWTRPDINLPPLTTYPFIVYTEVHDDRPVRTSPIKYFVGIEGIKEFVALYNSIMNTTA